MGKQKISSDPEVMRLREQRRLKQQRYRARKKAREQAAATATGTVTGPAGGNSPTSPPAGGLPTTQGRPLGGGFGIEVCPRDAEQLGRIEAYLHMELSRRSGWKVELDSEQARRWLRERTLLWPWLHEFIASQGLSGPLREFLAERP